MLSRKNVATVAIVAIVLALGAAGLVTAIAQVAHATVMKQPGPPCDKLTGDKNTNNDAACRIHGPPRK